MKKRNLNLVTDSISSSDEPFISEVDSFSPSEQNDYIDFLFFQFLNT